ncbi:O-antigen ligase family protein [Flaviaesturariibacter terrae]
MNFITSKPVAFLLGPLQLFLFLLPTGALFAAIPALAPLDAVINFLSFVLICLSVAYLFFSDEIRVSLAGSGALFLFLAFALLSMFWVLPGMKANASHQLTRMLLTVLQCYVIVNVLGRARLFDVLKQFAIGFALGNLAFMILFPGQAAWNMEDSSRIQGLFSSPNNMGQFLAFAFIVINFHKREGIPLALLLLLDAAIVYQMLKCDSMTSLGGVIVLFVCFQLRFLLKPLFVVIIAVGIIVPYLDKIRGTTSTPLGVNNRDMTFTGRTGVWEILRDDLAEQHRMTEGFGYGGYWLTQDEYNPYSHIHELEWWPGQGHNGYMDILVNTGIIGLVLVVFFLLRMVASIFRRASFDEPVLYFIPLIVLINNITEASLFREKHLYFVLLCLVFWYLFLQPEEATEPAPEAAAEGTLLAGA